MAKKKDAEETTVEKVVAENTKEVTTESGAEDNTENAAENETTKKNITEDAEYTSEVISENAEGKMISEEPSMEGAETTEIATENVTMETTEKTDEPKKTSSKKTEKTKKAKAHSAKYLQSTAEIDKNKFYDLVEAIEKVKKTSYTKFDGSVDAHINLLPSKKTDETVRGTVALPHGTGRERKIVIVTDEILEKIAKGWLDFDIAIATPDMMPKLAKLAKILGPKGLMPNPKSGTVTAEPEKAVAELKAGKVEFKADSLGNIHQSIGKVSWDAEKLSENFQAFLLAMPKGRVRRATLAPTMGASVKVSV